MSADPPARTWRELIAEASAILGSSTDARRIAECASGLDAAHLLVALDEPVAYRMGAHLVALVERRAGGEPLQYTLGSWGFRRLDLMVDRRVLIPRPETEQVVEVALDEARRVQDGRGGGRRPLVVADLGTGSGAIALSLALELPLAQVWATEASADALAVARANLAGLGGVAATRVRMEQGHWFDPLPKELRGALDVVVSNPPYIADTEVLDPQVADWEPVAALRAGPTGLECLATSVAAAAEWLGSDGSLVVEMAPHQAGEVTRLARDAGFAEVMVRPDLAGRDRALVARR